MTDNIRTNDYSVQSMGVYESPIQTGETDRQVIEEYEKILLALKFLLDQPIRSEEDAQKLYDTVQELKNLTTNGMYNSSSEKTAYLTQGMADGIKPLLDIISNDPKLSILFNSPAPSADELETALSTWRDMLGNQTLNLTQKLLEAMNVTGAGPGDIVPTWVLEVMITDIINNVNGKVESIANLQEILNKINAQITVLTNAAANAKINPFGSIPTFNEVPPVANDGLIPQAVVDKVVAAMNKMDTGDSPKVGDRFKKAYQDDLAIAQQASKNNGTTVEYEMSKLTGASKILNGFVENRDIQMRADRVEALTGAFTDGITELTKNSGVIPNITAQGAEKFLKNIKDMRESLAELVKNGGDVTKEGSLAYSMNNVLKDLERYLGPLDKINGLDPSKSDLQISQINAWIKAYYSKGMSAEDPNAVFIEQNLSELTTLGSTNSTDNQSKLKSAVAMQEWLLETMKQIMANRMSGMKSAAQKING